jgi:hypothetical protein
MYPRPLPLTRRLVIGTEAERYDCETKPEMKL